MQLFDLNNIITEQVTSDPLYHEFLRVPAMSLGLYILPAHSTDPQQPHNEDEVYYVVSGRGMIEVAGENQSVQSGTIVYVPAHAPHHFHSITEDLTIVVFFAPAETGD
ncbi:MAG: cupin domain-containing protein [Anaerolineales bacterium]|nr:cupin domain-containing protein [Anaerolineales bacterium]